MKDEMAAVTDRLLADLERFRGALEEIVALHLGDCPASMDEADFARAHSYRVRKIARDALAGGVNDKSAA